MSEPVEPPWVTMTRERAEEHARAIVEAEREWDEHEKLPYVPVDITVITNHRGEERLTISALATDSDLCDVRIDDGGSIASILVSRLDLIRLGHQLIKIGQRA